MENTVETIVADIAWVRSVEPSDEDAAFMFEMTVEELDRVENGDHSPVEAKLTDPDYVDRLSARFVVKSKVHDRKAAAHARAAKVVDRFQDVASGYPADMAPDRVIADLLAKGTMTQADADELREAMLGAVRVGAIDH